jgi:hypothetical protein
MWRTLGTALIVLALVCPASARHRHHHHGRSAPAWADSQAASESPFWAARDRTPRSEISEFVPEGWALQPPDPKWTGKRFVSPDGSAWFAAYSSEVATEPVPAHLRSIAFIDGETPTFIRGESDWIAVAGTKGDRMFFRKAVIACGGRTWHHIAFEYPIALSRHVEPLLRRASVALDGSENDGCDTPVAKTPAPAAAPATTTGSAPSQ